MVETDFKKQDWHLNKKAPAPWKLSGEGIIILYKFKKDWVEENAFLPDDLKGKFKGGLGYVMLVDYTESPVGPYKELLFIPGKFRKSKQQAITKIFVDSESSTVNGQANWGIPKETLPISWEKTEKKDQFNLLNKGKEVFSMEVKHGGISFPVSTALLPIRLCQTWKKLKYYTRPMGRGWGKLARVKKIELDPRFFPDIRNQKPLLAIRVKPFVMEFPESTFKDEIL